MKINGRRSRNILHFLLRESEQDKDTVCAQEKLSSSPMVRIMYDCN